MVLKKQTALGAVRYNFTTHQVCLLGSYMLCMLTYAFELQVLVYADCCHTLNVAHEPL